MDSQPIFEETETDDTQLAFVGGTSFIPFIKTEELNIGRRYEIKKMEWVTGQYGTRVRLTCDGFKYELTERFTKDLKDFDLELIKYEGIFFVYRGKEKCGKFMANNIAIYGLPNAHEMKAMRNEARATPSTGSTNECRICTAQDQNLYIIKPCMHAGFCESCCKRVKPCSVCREPIQGKDRIYL